MNARDARLSAAQLLTATRHAAQEGEHSIKQALTLTNTKQTFLYSIKNDAHAAFTYDDLPTDRKRIRLLRLYSDVLQSPTVTCKLFEVEFSEKEKLPRLLDKVNNPNDPGIEYEALSWRWSDEDNSEYTIMIRKKNKIYRKRVSQTLGLALKYLRRESDRILWVDAICINQKDKKERSYQVSMMSLVYTSATQVCVWLGEEDENSRKAFRFIREDITHLKDFDRLCSDQKHAHKWSAFVGLMQRDWFSRRWVVQEIALAPKASVHCGPDSLQWRELAIAVELFVEVETATHRLSELLRKDDKSRLVPNWFEHISELGASLLVNATARIFREYQRGDRTVGSTKRRSLLSLEYLVTSLSVFDCGWPHDSVYALLAIARDASPDPPSSVDRKGKQALIQQVFNDQLEQKPYLLDYHRPYPDVCKDFVHFCIERCAKMDALQALDILCRPWAKDWRPGDDKTTEDERPREVPVKKRIFKERKDVVWQISWSTHAQKLLEHDGGRLVKAIAGSTAPMGDSAAQPGVVDPATGTKEDDQAAAGASKTPRVTQSEGEISHGNAETSKRNRSSDQVTKRWKQGWEDYEKQRIKLNDAFDALFTPERRRKTHVDTRNMDDYKNRVGFSASPIEAEDLKFVSRAFPVRQDKPKAINSETRQSRKSPEELAKEEAEWSKEERDNLEHLTPDPQLKKILHVKSECARIDEARAEQAKLKQATGMASKPLESTSALEKREEKGIRELGLPSWVAKIDCAPFDIFPHPGMDMMKMGRKNADPLVGIPQDGHRNYSAGQTKEIDLNVLAFRRRAILGHYSLYVKGFTFDRVAKVAQVSQAGAIPASWLDLAGWSEARRYAGSHGDLEDPPDAFWRTLVADRGRNDRNPPYYYARACKETILKGGIRSNAVDTTALIYNERNSIIAEFCRRVQAVIWNRALIKTKSGVLGLVSEHVREGDLVCVIYGCTVPVILRRENAKFKTKNEYDNEKLEDDIESMKRLVGRMERYRDRKHRYSELSDNPLDVHDPREPPPWEKNDVKKKAWIVSMTKWHNSKHGKEKTPEQVVAEKKTKKELREIEKERVKLLGHDDKQSEDEDSEADVDDDATGVERDSQRPEEEENRAELTEEQQSEMEQQAQAKIDRQKLRQRKAKVRDPLRHYKILDQAYVHGMMDGDAVRQKFYSGRPDHIFEIR